MSKDGKELFSSEPPIPKRYKGKPAKIKPACDSCVFKCKLKRETKKQ